VFLRNPSRVRAAAEAIVIAVLSGIVALIFNGVRTNSLPIFATTAYQILVPCPEPGGPVQVIEASDPAIASTRTFIIDARSQAEYNEEHLERAMNIAFDWLDPVPDEHLNRLAIEIASSRATRVVVYGDGGRPDSGEYLGKEISGRGIKNVFYIEGGAPFVLTGTDE